MSAPHHLSAAWADADALRAKGQLTAARDLLEPVADVAAIRLGPDDPDVLETMRRLALVHRELGELATARRVLEEALEGASLRLTDDHPLVLGISAELGAIADELGNRHEARRNMSRVARFGPAVLGEDHPYVREAHQFLGTAVPAVAAPPEPAVVRPPVQEEPGVYRPAEPAPPRTPEPRAPEPRAPEPTNPWATEPEPEPEPARPAPRLEHSALPWYQKTEPEPVDPFTPYPPPRFGVDDEHEDLPRRSRTPLLVLGVLGLALLVAVVTVGLVVVLRPHPSATAGAGATTPSSGVTTPGAAPTDVKLRDDGGTVTLTWTDPSSGTVPFFVEVGKPGAQLQLYGTLPQGETKYRVVGLNPHLDYCFSVIAVYGTNVVAPSNLVCTQRASNSAPSPNR